MIKKQFFRYFYKPKLCSKINTRKYPWGWKSQKEIKDIIVYPLNNEIFNIEHHRTFVHEYNLISYTKEIYNKTKSGLYRLERIESV